MSKSIYQKHGHDTRNDYLRQISRVYEVDEHYVFHVSHRLGEQEDFDGLITHIEDNLEELRNTDFSPQPMYEYEVEIKQVIHKMFLVDASDAESAQEEAYEQFHLEKDGDVDTDVISCEMMWAGEEPTEAEKARQEADARQEEDV
tara:strand:+ start:1363 stop:1797 length:435 start_codon:yes stop_codon:yes gene_type:complete